MQLQIGPAPLRCVNRTGGLGDVRSLGFGTIPFEREPPDIRHAGEYRVLGGAMELEGHLDRVERVAHDLDRELAVTLRAMRRTRDLREQGLLLSAALRESGGPAHRESVIQLAQRLIDVLHDYRAETIRHLVDEEGWSITDIARRTGSARQVIARLYHSARGSSTSKRVPSPKLRLEPSTPHRGKDTANS